MKIFWAKSGSVKGGRALGALSMTNHNTPRTLRWRNYIDRQQVLVA